MQSNKLGKDTYKEIVGLFSELLAIPSPSGMENTIADFIIEKCTTLGYHPKKDQTGNVYVTIEGKNIKEVTVFNQAGTFMSTHENLLNSISLMIDLSALPDGVYFFQITTKEGVVTRKVVKQQTH